MRFTVAIGCFAFVYLAWGSSPAWFWLDSGEISAAAGELGVMHPPGAPGLLPVFHLLCALPIGNLAYRIALGSSFLAAVSIAIQALMLRERGVRPWIVVIMALMCLGSLTFIRNARVAEIYSFATCLTMVSLWGWCRIDGKSRCVSRNLIALMTACWAMLGFGDLRIAFGVGILMYGFRSVRQREPWISWVPWLTVMASFVLLSIPLSSARHPHSDWGDPDSWWRLWDHVHASSIRAAFAEKMWPSSWALWKGYTNQWFEQVFEDLGIFTLVIMIAALLLLWRRSQERSLASWLTWLIAVEMFYAIAINPMGTRDRQNSMMLAPVAGLAIGVAWEYFLRGGSRFRWFSLPVVVPAVLVIPFWTSQGDVRNTRSWMPHAWTRSALAQLPPGALLLTQSDDLSAGSVVARVFEGARPDIVSAPVQHLYRKPPDRARNRRELEQLWRLAALSHIDSDRIALLYRRWEGPLAVELPGIGMFSGLQSPIFGGKPPLEIRGQVKDPKVFEQAVMEWLPQVQGDMDRHRLARSLDSYARRFRTNISDSGHASAESHRRVAWMYSEILRQVDDEDIGSLLNLAVLLFSFGQTESAIEMSRHAMILDPLRVAAVVQVAGLVARSDQNKAQALRLAKQALELSPSRSVRTKTMVRLCQDIELPECRVLKAFDAQP